MVQIQLICPIFFGIVFPVFTLVFIFWFVFLLQDVISRRAYYKSALRSFQESHDHYQQQEVYKAKTDYVKSIFLFNINILEWLAVTMSSTAFVYLNVSIGLICKRKIQFIHSGNTSLSNLTYNNCFKDEYSIFSNSLVYSNIYFMAYSVFLFSLTLIACLCNYLTARYSRKSWIKHNRIPYFITLIILVIIVTHLSTLVCALTLIVRIIHWIVSIIVLAIAIQQSRRLRMVLNWTIVDLEISKNNPRLLKMFKQRNKQLKMIFLVIWLGCFFILISFLIDTVEIGTQFLLQLITEEKINYNSFCTLQKNYIPIHIFEGFSILALLFTFFGLVFALMLYFICGFGTMLVVIWFRIRGKTGYKTHFPNPLRKPLVS
ncbi:hypothetical protein LOD99_10025 [Oopsacas minuta]|uniref:G-protein coupled receptors family 1 profile domain-containing protein n=1 Tax=Oopsacas minuta TaxID=111878 RepID=A0AAV7KKG7_9METZ|nr:hypothetical protein LOD99_10025 [Oopsacas minuta]